MTETDFDDYSEEELALLERDELIEIIIRLRDENDDLRKIQRTPQGEPIASDDEVVNDEEEVVT